MSLSLWREVALSKGMAFMAGSWEAMAREEGEDLGPQDLEASLKSNFTRGFLVLLCVAPIWQHTQIMNQVLTPHLCAC